MANNLNCLADNLICTAFAGDVRDDLTAEDRLLRDARGIGHIIAES